MTFQPRHTSSRTDPAAPITMALMLMATLGIVLVMIAVTQRVHSDDAVLPVVLTLLLIAAAASAVAGFLSSRRLLLDLAGLLTLVGLVAGAMVEPEQMVRLITPAQSGG